MDKQTSYIELVKKARLGDKQSLDRLSELAAKRLRVYVYRLTLADDLTAEIVQETMLEMFRILGKLKKADRFWPWLYSIATNKIHRHQRTERTQQKLARSSATPTFQQREQGLENLVGKELRQIVTTAMQGLKTRHRAVLVMRCYDQMSYAQIAESMGCSEFSTRMLFVRAKRSLQRQLLRNGFGRGSLLAALVLFGKMTAPTEAAATQVSVTAATTGVGVLAGLVGLATTKTAIVSIAAAAVLTVGTVVAPLGNDNAARRLDGRIADGSRTLSPLGRIANGDEQVWYYYPEGPGKSVMMRIKPGAHGAQLHSQFLQNDRANYYFNDNTIHINNYRMYAADLSVLRLPTDSPQLTEFLDNAEGVGERQQKMQHVSAGGEGLLVIASRNAGQGPNRPWVTRHDNVLDEDYFQGDWPSGSRTLDRRDEMHRRGWTCFTISGSINGQKISGTGRIPFVYAAARLQSPWLRLNIGDSITVIDTADGACVRGADGAVLVRYRPGSFFKGLSRPWAGLHTIDTVRRDAAQQRIFFDTRNLSDNKVEIRLAGEPVTLTYYIDLEADLVVRIAFSMGDNNAGEMSFSYLQDVDDAADRFAAPKVSGTYTRLRQSPGLSWLVQLAQGALAE